MGIESFGRAIKKELFKQVPDSSAFAEEIHKEGSAVSHIEMSVEDEDKGVSQDSAGTRVFSIVGEAFGPSGEKLASFREKIGEVSYFRAPGNEMASKTGDLAEQANQKLEEAVAKIKEGSKIADLDKKISTKPYQA